MTGGSRVRSSDTGIRYDGFFHTPDQRRTTITHAPAMMRALVYAGAGLKALEARAKPQLEHATDAIVKMSSTTICGTDLQILRGQVPTCTAGRILGHEGVGTIDAVGSAVTAFAVGDSVLVSCITSCGTCAACRRAMYSRCTHGGWILGNTIDGTQADFVRIPFADTSLYAAGADLDSAALVMLSDLCPSAFESGVRNGNVAPGKSVAIVGSGPVGLAALLTARLYSPATIIVVDIDDDRLAAASRLGATATINSDDRKAIETIAELTGQRGVDTAIEAVGLPDAFEMCELIVAVGGTIANIGIHGAPVTLHLDRLWNRNVTITTHAVDTSSTPMLLEALRSNAIAPAGLITHRLDFEAIVEAYAIFSRATGEHALKILIAM